MKRYRCLSMLILLPALLLVPAGRARAAFGEDIDKPKPEFTKADNSITARLIPRGKSASIQIRFDARGAALQKVYETAFAPAEQPDVDIKNFRSGFFTIEAAVDTPGAAATLSLSSPYFTSATELWAPLQGGGAAWGKTEAASIAQPDASNTLALNVEDGGPLDADGRADGHLKVILAPRDSFWGYALGTLFIRFFGIFLVLTILMIGMLLSGGLYQWFEQRGRRAQAGTEGGAAPVSGQQPAAASAPAPGAAAGQTVDPDVAAAVAVALHLSTEDGRKAETGASGSQGAASAWALAGRCRILVDRMPVFERNKPRR